MKLKNLSITVGLFTVILFFQNCGQNFRANLSDIGDLSSESLNDLPTGDLIEEEDNNTSGGSNTLPTSSTSSTGKIYYVSTKGNNADTGTFSKPFRTVKYAVGKMVAGDTAYVRGGLYNEGTIRFARSGTQTKQIKLLNYPKELPIIDFGVNNDREKIFRIEFNHEDNQDGVIENAIGWITLEGFEIRNGYNAVKYYNLHDSVFRRNNIHHHVSSGIKGNGTLRVTIDRNVMHTVGDFEGCARGDLTTNGEGKTTVCNQQHGIYIDGNSVKVTNNIFYNNLCTAVQQNGSSAYSPAGHASPEFSGANDWIIANNTFAYQYYCPAISVWGSRTNNTKITNNIFYENGSSRSASGTNAISLYASNPAMGITISNNLSYASGSGATQFIGDSYNSYTEGVHYKQSGNIVNTLNPRFVNAPATLPASPNFALTAQSPAIDKGLTLTETKTDLRGVIRPRGGAYDIGALEYMSAD